MTNIEILGMLIAWSALLVNNALLMTTLMMQVLLLIAFLLGGVSKFIGLIMFMVYVGGIMILISYCVMLIPDRKFTYMNILLLLFMIFSSLPFSLDNKMHGSFSFGLLYSGGTMLMLGLLLFVVMVVVVDIIDYSSGMIKT